MWQPVITIGVIVIPLVFVGQYFLQAQFSSADYRSLPATSQSRIVAQDMANDFPGGNSNPVQVVIRVPASPASPSVAGGLKAYFQGLNNQPGVTGVTETTSGDYVLANVTYNSGYDELLARDLVSSIRSQPHPSGWSVNVGGMTAELVDLLDSIGSHAIYAGAVVALSLFVLLLFMFRSIAVPLEALFVNILSLSATFGILVWIFQYGHLSRLLGFTSLGSIDSTQPVLIFGIAFGLSMDYSVFLFSRIKEQYDQSAEVRQSIADGLDKTGTIITSAAVLFIVVVAAFATSSISLIKQIGIGLGLAVFIDAFLVRMLLMPAIMAIVGHANWWGPKWMRSRLALPRHE
jgi:RND superfamily putative drug exporter